VANTTADLKPTEQLYDITRNLHYDKPLLRGWMHLICFVIALVVGTLVVIAARGDMNTTLAVVYASTVTGMFGVSALYHRGRWGARSRARLQRMDHLMIFLLIAGTSTAPLAICLPSPYSWIGLSVMWTMTLLAASGRLVRMQLPEWLAGTLFIGLGWMASLGVPAVWIHSGVAPAVLLIAGGVLYTIGALSFYRRWPDPAPTVFGYHEVFHTFVSVAAACQYVAIAGFLL
jgi:hemolysin III